SVLISGGGRVRLAPLYDVASALPYDGLDFQKLKLAMKFGGEYRLRDIGARHVARLAKEARLDPAKLVTHARALALQTPNIAAQVGIELNEAGLAHPIIPRLIGTVTARAQRLAGLLEA